MKYLIRKEIAGFFSSAMGYVILLVWFLAASLMLWFFNGEYNLPDGGYATLRPFFSLSAEERYAQLLPSGLKGRLGLANTSGRRTTIAFVS